jgi:type II secretory pathway component PulF
VNYSEWRLNFFRSLTVLLSAGIPLHTSLQFIQDQQKDQDASVLSDMAETLMSGYRFSQALAAQKDRFEPFHINSIRIAEETGSLVRTIAELEVCEQKRVAHSRLLKGKLTYPAILAVVCLLVVIALPAFCLDGLLQVIRQNTDTVPFLTQGLIAFNTFLSQPLLWVGVGAAIVWASLNRHAINRRIKETRFCWTLLSLVGPLNQLRHLSSALVFSNSLALQLEVGQTPLQALPLAAGTTGDPLWEQLGLSAAEKLVEGETFSGAFAGQGFLDPIFLSILAVGQESGKLPRLLKSYVKMCQEELEYRIEQILALLEPTLLLLMGFVFAIIMLATLQPMLSLVHNL